MRRYMMAFLLLLTIVAAMPQISDAASVAEGVHGQAGNENAGKKGQNDDDEDIDEDDTDDELYDWDKISQSMTKKESGLGLDFAKVRREYAVVASVASTGANEECGSKEKFYFQLLFENGSSGVVLANTQLPADGFRTGTDEVFFIRTNRDYGELQSVRIIPMPVGEGTFDKLKLDNITVSETDATGISEKWMIEDIGWIGSEGADYNAESEKEDRTIADISNVYGVTGQGTTVNLLVCLATTDFSYKDELLV